MILIPDNGVNLLILNFDLSNINLICLSVKPQQFKRVFPLVAAPIPYIGFRFFMLLVTKNLIFFITYSIFF